MMYYNYLRKAQALILALTCCMTVVPTNVAAQENPFETVSGEGEDVYRNTGAEDNDELFAGYVEGLFDLHKGTEVSTDGIKNTGRRFDEGTAPRVIYDAIHDAAVKIATGELTSTLISLTGDDIGLGQSNACSAADLGVSAIIENDAFTEEASEALKAKLKETVQLDKVLDSLLADHPYEFYWYDKTAGTSTPYKMSAFHDGTEWKAFITTYELKLAPAAEYKGSEAYTVDPSIAQTAVAASQNAKNIVVSHADEDDMTKLQSYRTEICDLVSYNHDAVDNDADYGNPWQLIWVFDQDDSTEVVCEGYSKAFQYLCDQTDFENDEITCYTVTGTMDGGTGAGNHMWNIVTMDDGRNYLADVTNCDSGTIGYPDLLFLAKYTSGNVGDGYVFNCGDSEITYQYSSDTKDLFDESELTIYDLPVINVTGISISPDAVDMKIGETTVLSASVEPSDATDQSVTWMSSDESVATVDDSGNVEAINEGQAIITATSSDPDIYAECTVTVSRDNRITSLSFKEDRYTMEYHENWYIWDYITYSPDDADINGVEITSDHPEILDVQDGWLYPRSRGTATITVDAGDDISDTADFTVLRYADSIAPDGTDEVKIKIDETRKLKYKLYPENEILDEEITWMSLNGENEVFELNSATGEVKGLNYGDGYVQAVTKQGWSAGFNIHVYALPEGIHFNHSENYIPLDDSVYIWNYLNVDNWEAWNCPLTIESSNEDVISVEGDYLHALSRDKATIKVRTENGKTASADFYAGNYAQSITRDSWERIYLKLNDRQSLSYRLEPEGGDFSDEEVIWTVNDYSNCISFNEETREVTATGYGTASINARIQSGSEVNYDISVYKEPETLEFKSKQNYVKLYYSYDIREFLDITPAEAYYCPITISTPDPDAIWTGDYFIGTGKKGTVTIGVATGDTQWDTADFTVGDFANGISPDGDNYRRVHVDNETQFSYQLYAWDNNYEDEVVTWTIESGEDVVSLLDQNGNVKALAPGNAVIHASIQDGTYAEYYVEVPVPVERFELNPDSDIMPYGDAWYVWDRVSYEPNDADLSDVIIESDHPEIIDVQGEWMYANSTGTAKITLDAGNGVVSSFDITVIWFAENIMPTGQDLIYLETGKSTELGYSLYPFDSNEKPVWTVDDGGEQYVTVDENGLVTGVSPGQATVRGTIRSGSSVVYTVNVADPVTKIDFNTEEITVNRGDSLNLRDYLVIEPESAKYCWLTFSSNDQSIARTEASYTSKVYGMAVGSTVVTADDGNGHTASVKVTVVPGPAESIMPTGKDLIYLHPGDTETLGYKLYPADTEEKPVWTVQDYGDQCVTVDENGVVEAVSAGKAFVRGSIQNGNYIEYTVNVADPIEYIAFRSKELFVTKGESLNLRDYLVIEPAGAEYCFLTYSSDDYTIARTEASYTSYVYGVSVGSTTVYADDGEGHKVSVKVTVLGGLADVIMPTANELIYLEIGKSKQLGYQLYPEDSSEKPYWYVEDYGDQCVTVDENGLVTAVSPGRAYVSAMIGNGGQITYSINTADPATDIQFTEDELFVRLGDRLNLRDYLKFEPASAEYCWLTFSSEDYTIARTEASYTSYVYGDSLGSTTVTVKDANGIGDTVKVTVLDDIASVIMPSGQDTVYLETGGTQQLQYTLYPNNAAEKPVWTVETGGENIVSVDEDGVVKGISPGQAIVRGTIKNGSYVKYTVNVADPVTNITFNTDEIILNKGEAVNLRDYLVIEPASAEYAWLTFSSDDYSIARTEASYTSYVYGVSVGSTKVYADDGNGHIADVTVTVDGGPAVYIMPSGPDQMFMHPGDTRKLGYELYPEDSSEKPVWTVSEWGDQCVEIVDGDTVKALSPGKATVRGEIANGYSVNYTIMVAESASSMKFKQDEILILSGRFIDLRNYVEIFPSTAKYTFLECTSGDYSIASVESSYSTYLRAIQPGTTTVTVKDENGLSADVTVTVLDGYASTIYSVNNTVYMDKDDTAVLEYRLESPSGNLNKEKLSFVVTKGQDIVSVSDHGVVRASGYGQATVEARTALYGQNVAGAYNTFAIYTINVAGEPSGLHFMSDEYYVNLGSSVFIPASTSSPETEYCRKVYTSSDTDILGITYPLDGQFYPLKEGTVTVTCTAGDGVSASATVHVLPEKEYYMYYSEEPGTPVVMNVGEAKDLKPKLNIRDYVGAIDFSRYTWESDNDSVATVEDGIVTAVSSGSVVISVKETATGKIRCSVTIYVSDTLQYFDFAVPEYNMFIGQDLSLRTLLEFKPVTEVFNDVSFISGDESIVQISHQYTRWGAIALKEGDVEITARKSTGEVAYLTVHVAKPAVPDSISLSKDEAFTVHVAHARKPALTIGPAGADQTQYVLTSADPEIAEINAYSGIIGVTPGTTQVTAYLRNDPSQSVTFDVTVLAGVSDQYRYYEKVTETSADLSFLSYEENKDEYTCYVGRSYSFSANAFWTLLDGIETPVSPGLAAPYEVENNCILIPNIGYGAASGPTSFGSTATSLYFLCVREGTLTIKSLGGRIVTIHVVNPPTELEILAEEIANAEDPGDAATFDTETGEIKEKIEEAKSSGETIKVELESELLDEVTETEETLVIEASAADEDTIVEYYDINLLLKAGNNEDPIAKIVETKEPITVSIPLTEASKTAGATYKVIRVHDGVAEELECEISEDGNYLIFKTDRFSTYALVIDQHKTVIQRISLILKEKIEAKFYIYVPDSDLATTDIVVKFNGKETLLEADAFEPKTMDGKDCVVVSVSTFAKQMRDDIQITVQDRETEAPKYLERNEKDVTEGFHFKVADYVKLAEANSDDPALLDLVHKMDNYGRYAQIQFKYNLGSFDQADPIEDFDDSELEKYKVWNEGSVDGLEYMAGSLELESDTGIRVYYKLQEGADISNYTFTVDGGPAQPVHKKGNQYYIAVKGIPARLMHKPHIIAVTDQAGNTLTTTYRSLSYPAAVVASDAAPESLKNLCRSIDLYAEAALTYFGEE